MKKQYWALLTRILRERVKRQKRRDRVTREIIKRARERKNKKNNF